MDIKGIVNNLCATYDTRNPFDLAYFMGISIVSEPLGSIRGYYQNSYRHKIIHINSDLSEPQQRFTCAHELGHSVLHPQINTPFLRENTLFVISRFENEANQFATQLLFSDDDFQELISFSIAQISQTISLHESLVEYKIKSMV